MNKSNEIINQKLLDRLKDCRRRVEDIERIEQDANGEFISTFSIGTMYSTSGKKYIYNNQEVVVVGIDHNESPELRNKINELIFDHVREELVSAENAIAEFMKNINEQ